MSHGIHVKHLPMPSLAAWNIRHVFLQRWPCGGGGGDRMTTTRRGVNVRTCISKADTEWDQSIRRARLAVSLCCASFCAVRSHARTHTCRLNMPPPTRRICTCRHVHIHTHRSHKSYPCSNFYTSLFLYLFLAHVAALELMLLPLKLTINSVLDIKWCMCKEVTRQASAPCVGLLMIRVLLTISVTI